jgi:hypothetical protein
VDEHNLDSSKLSFPNPTYHFPVQTLDWRSMTITKNANEHGEVLDMSGG